MTRKKVMVNILHMGTTMSGLESKMIGWMSERRDNYDFELFLPTARPIPNNRNRIVKQFLEGDYDILFMFDDDNMPIKNPFSILDHDVDVCGGVYPGRTEKGFNFHVFERERKKKKVSWKFVGPDKREGLQKVDAVATGCMAIKRNVLEKMKKKKLAPFEETFDKEGILTVGDDMGFCLKCEKLEIPVHADWNIICDHIKKTSLLECVRLIEMASRTGEAKINVKDKIVL